MFLRQQTVSWRNEGALILFVLLLFFFHSLNGQYFNGPNKPDYKIFNYKVYTTPHFEIYHYFDNDSLLNNLASETETWYQRHFMIFKDTFKDKNPVLFYANHADFQQTNAIMGTIGVGTGGVTEALKNRVVLPIMESASQTNHVIGHELVHAFQYNIILGEDSTQMRNIRNIPLWMIEGMAEYLSIGSVDPHTSMWMRDAIINNDFPTLEDMSSSYKYFPYRYGQAFWAYVTGSYGDSIIKPLFDLTTKIGYDKALDSLFHIDEKVFSTSWKKAMKDHYYKLLPDTIERPVGKKILNRKNSGATNIAPSVSPDGKFIIYLSEKDLFTFDLYIADAATGKGIKQISSTVRNNQIDDFNFLESGGSWSPDSRKFAFVTFSEGKNKLLVIDLKKRSKSFEVSIPGVDAFSNPAWSPDGMNIVVTGLKEGVTDLYAYHIADSTVQNLTNDIYCNLLSSWSPDGKLIIYSTDQPNSAGKDRAVGYNLAVIDFITRQKQILPVLIKSNNLNAQFSSNGENIYFISDANGIRNLYKYSLISKKLFRMTTLITGISGITEFTPAITVSQKTDNIIYTHYFKGDYNIYQADDTCFHAVEVKTDSINFDIAALPPLKRAYKDIVNPNILDGSRLPKVPIDSFKSAPYRSKFQLDYIGGSSVGVAVNSYYGTGMAGSVDMLFGDMVGHYQLYSSLSINGQIQDFAGSVAFVNNKNKIDWGVALSHIPYKYGDYNFAKDSVEKRDVLNVDVQWIFEDAVTLFAVKPLSQTQRIEASTSMSHYSYYVERYTYPVTDYGYGSPMIQKNLPTEKGFSIATVGAAYTLDNSYMGIASPLRGQRFRFEVDQYIGALDFTNFLIDYRKYFYFRPFCFAMRLYHQGRYGGTTSNNVIRSLYLGWPWLVRGFYNFFGIDNPYTDQSQLFGGRIGVANAELRIPFTGPERLCLIPFKYFVSELSFFTDAGIAWNNLSEIKWVIDPPVKRVVNYVNAGVSQNSSLSKEVIFPAYRFPSITYGISLRINLFGYMIIEPYYSIPYIRNWKNYAGVRFNLLPGW
jgi:Tol biopolymer transport system component